MASMTKLSTKEIIEQRDKAFAALRWFEFRYRWDFGVCPCGGSTPYEEHEPGCIVAIALEEQP